MRFLPGLALAAGLVAAAVVYARPLPGEYVYDDLRFVARNPAVTAGASFTAYFAEPATQTADGSHEGLWRPLRTLSFRAVHLVAPGPGPQRIANLLFHLANGILVFLLVRRLFGDRFSGPAAAAAPGLAAALFLVHPLAAEPVAWISGRGDLLAATGMFAAAWLHLRPGRTARIAGLLAFAAALLAKESAAVLPAMLVLLDLLAGGFARVRARLPAWGPHFAVLAAWLVIRSAVLGPEFGQGEGRGLERGVLLAGAFAEGLYYLRTTLLPFGLSFELHMVNAVESPLLASAGLLAAAALAAIAIRVRARAPAAAAGILWFLAALVPVTLLQVFFPLKILVANRFAYPALAGAALVLAAIARRGPRFAMLAGMAIVALVPVAAQRAEAFSDPERLWSDVLAKDPENPVALFGLGFERYRRAEWGEAARLLTASAAADPTHPMVAAALGESLEHLAAAEPPNSQRERIHVARAFEAYHAAVRLWQAGAEEGRAAYPATLVDAAWLAIVNGRPDLAAEHVRTLLAMDPANPPDPISPRMRQRIERLAGAFAHAEVPEAAKALERRLDEWSGGGR